MRNNTLSLDDIKDIAYQVSEWKDGVSITEGTVISVYRNFYKVGVSEDNYDDVLSKVEDKLISLSSDNNVRKMWTYNGQLVSMYGNKKWYLDDTESTTNMYVQFLFTKKELKNSPFNLNKLQPASASEHDLSKNEKAIENIKTVFNT